MSSQLSDDAARRLRPDGPFHLSPGAQPIEATITLTVTNCATQPELVLVDIRRDYSWRMVMTAHVEQADTWVADVRMPMAPTIIHYDFKIDGETLQERRQVENDAERHNIPLYGEWQEMPFRIAVYDPDRMPADWTQGMTIYQIFPDRFARTQTDEAVKAAMKGVYGHEAVFKEWDDVPESPPLGRDFFGGDIPGIIERLDYLQDLGVECIYLNPIFEASANHRYEAIDFMKIDDMLGTQEDFDRLVEEAHRRDIRIVLDAVFNHCSSDSIYFDIIGKFTAETGIPGATQSKESPYYRWFTFDNWPHAYRGWIGLGFMPEFVECPEMEEYFLGPDGVTAHWLNRGIDGWRCDVAFDNTDEFWRRFRNRVEAVKPDVYLISEEWRDSTHYMLGDMFSGTMNYRLMWALRGFCATDQLKPTELDDRLMTWIRDTPPPALKAQMNLIDSHDTDRALTACGGDRTRFKQMVAFLLAYAGAPMIYYGDEVGLEGDNAEDGRRTFPWGNIDQEIYGFFKRIMKFRRESMALRHGETETVVIDDDRMVYGFARRLGHEVVYALFNGGDNTISVQVPLAEGEVGRWVDVLEMHAAVEAEDDHLTVELQPRGAAWYVRGGY